MVGRIESYIHSDNITPHKGGVMIRVVCDTDFAARTPDFIEFCEFAAKRSFAAQSENWQGVVDLFPDVEQRRLELSKKLKEKIDVDSIHIVYT